jgi:hypothetical protein
MLTCVSILRYAENIEDCLESKSITLEKVLKDHLGPAYTEYIMSYYKARSRVFGTESGSYNTNYKTIEKRWFKEDDDYSFKGSNIEIK